jgi:hypothetical protein
MVIGVSIEKKDKYFECMPNGRLINPVQSFLHELKKGHPAAYDLEK